MHHVNISVRLKLYEYMVTRICVCLWNTVALTGCLIQKDGALFKTRENKGLSQVAISKAMNILKLHSL